MTKFLRIANDYLCVWHISRILVLTKDWKIFILIKFCNGSGSEGTNDIYPEFRIGICGSNLGVF